MRLWKPDHTHKKPWGRGVLHVRSLVRDCSFAMLASYMRSFRRGICHLGCFGSVYSSIGKLFMQLLQTQGCAPNPLFFVERALWNRCESTVSNQFATFSKHSFRVLHVLGFRIRSDRTDVQAVGIRVCVWERERPIWIHSRKQTQTHTHTDIYIHIYICVCTYIHVYINN